MQVLKKSKTNSTSNVVERQLGREREIKMKEFPTFNMHFDTLLNSMKQRARLQFKQTLTGCLININNTLYSLNKKIDCVKTSCVKK